MLNVRRLAGLKAALGNPADFPNCLQPHDLGVGEYPLEYAIYWSPLPFIIELIEAGADAHYPDQAGFPSLIAALSTDRPNRLAVLTLLLDNGADVGQRGINDWTPLHYAVVQRDLPAVELLLEYGADPSAPDAHRRLHDAARGRPGDRLRRRRRADAAGPGAARNP